MENLEKLDLKITLILGNDSTLRDLEVNKNEFYNHLSSHLVAQADIQHPVSSRSIDPSVIGAIGLAILPVAIEKLGDLIIKWTELRRDCTVKLTIPLKGKKSIEFSYNPKTTSKESLKKWIESAIESSKAG